MKTKKKKFELASFRADVVKSYAELLGYLDEETHLFWGHKKKITVDGKRGIIKRSILGLGRWSQQTLKESYLQSEEFLETKARAKSLAEDEEIRRIVCPGLRKEVRSNAFKEEKEIETIRIVTRELTTAENKKLFSIETNASLYSMVVREILETGVENYCDKPRE